MLYHYFFNGYVSTIIFVSYSIYLFVNLSKKTFNCYNL